MAADPGDQRSEVHSLQVSGAQTDVLAQPQRDEALSEHVFHRLAHAEVDSEGQNS